MISKNVEVRTHVAWKTKEIGRNVLHYKNIYYIAVRTFWLYLWRIGFHKRTLKMHISEYSYICDFNNGSKHTINNLIEYNTYYKIDMNITPRNMHMNWVHLKIIYYLFRAKHLWYTFLMHKHDHNSGSCKNWITQLNKMNLTQCWVLFAMNIISGIFF